MKRLFLLTIVVALHIFLLVACGKNNSSNYYPQGRIYDYNTRYGDHFRNFPINYHRYGHDACGNGWHTGWHYQHQEKFCFSASFSIGFDPYPFDNYSRILCNPHIPSHIACPHGSYCQPVSYYSDYGFCANVW